MNCHWLLPLALLACTPGKLPPPNPAAPTPPTDPAPGPTEIPTSEDPSSMDALRTAQNYEEYLARNPQADDWDEVLHKLEQLRAQPTLPTPGDPGPPTPAPAPAPSPKPAAAPKVVSPSPNPQPAPPPKPAPPGPAATPPGPGGAAPGGCAPDLTGSAVNLTLGKPQETDQGVTLELLAVDPPVGIPPSRGEVRIRFSIGDTATTTKLIVPDKRSVYPGWAPVLQHCFRVEGPTTSSVHAWIAKVR